MKNTTTIRIDCNTKEILQKLKSEYNKPMKVLVHELVLHEYKNMIAENVDDVDLEHTK